MKNALLLLSLLWIFDLVSAQTQTAIDTDLLYGLEYRSIGPSRGGRVTAVAGVPGELFTFYMGASGGGVWKTTDAGTTWQNISDEFFKVGSIGAITIAPSDRNVVYVGTGSAEPRGNVSTGLGVYKSTDAGETWQHIGLEKAGLIGKIIVHPSNPDWVYVAVLGNIFGHNPERGVYRSKNGGENWEKVHFVSEKTGAIDLVMHPTNPRILYAGMWTAQRTPWTMIDGSQEGGVWKTTNGGDSWEKLEKDLPGGLLGKIGLAISPANGQRVWAQIENADESKGGLYRSDDGGKSWKRINRDHNLRQRAWYYSRIVADPNDENTLYNMNVRFWKSIDGGNNFSSIGTPHGDNHCLWINPNHSNIMIEGNDGGACVTLNGGKTWSTIYNQPTAEFYRVTTDNQFPYRVYGAQQDNSTISVGSKIQEGITPFQDWFSIGGGESGHIAVDPRDPNVIYAGTYIGIITYRNREQGYQRNVVAYPQMHDGVAPRDIKYRFQWNAPIRISPHDPDVVYHCSQFVHRTNDQGKSWEVISPDLTTNYDAYQNIPGGPIQHDHTGVELYTTIFSFEEAHNEPGVLWAGSDDGLIHVSLDNGQNWKNVTPGKMPKGGTVNTIDISTHQEGRVIASVFKYRENDFRPYIFLTNDYGKSWSLLTNGENGIPENHFVRVTREDPERKGLFYAGTEFGMYISFDEGRQWQSFQKNLPVVPITDMVVKDKDLVIATQGRSFWIMDDLTPVRELQLDRTVQEIRLLPPSSALRSQMRGFRNAPGIDRAPNGAIVYFYLPEKPDKSDTISLSIADPTGKVRRAYSTHPDKSKHESKLKIEKGLNKIEWNLRYEEPKILENAVFSLASTSGVRAYPGVHQVILKKSGVELNEKLEVGIDPRWNQTASDLKAQYDLTMEAKNLLEQVHESIRQLRSTRSQLQLLMKRLDDMSNSVDLKTKAEELVHWITEKEKQLIQTKSESRQDPINFPSMLDDQVAYLYSNVNAQDDRPTKGVFDRFADLEVIWKDHREAIAHFINDEITGYNQALQKAGMKLINVKIFRP